MNNPTSLTAQHVFIAAQAIQREIWQVRKAQVAPGKVYGGCVGFHFGGGRRATGFDPLKQGMNRVMRVWNQFPVLPIIAQMLGNNPASIAVARRSRHNTLAKRSTSSRSMAD